MTPEEKEAIDLAVKQLEYLMRRRSKKCDGKDIFLDIADVLYHLPSKYVAELQAEVIDELKRNYPKCFTGKEDIIRADDPQDDWIPPWRFRCPCEIFKKEERLEKE